MRNNDYFPYLNAEDAQNEYNSLREEILNSQKQRMQFVSFSIMILLALTGYFNKDFSISGDEMFILVFLSVAPALFSLSTRYKERRIASYIAVYMKTLSPWSCNSSKLGDAFFHRSSLNIVIIIIVFDITLICIQLQHELQDANKIVYVLGSSFATIINFLVAYKLVTMPDYKRTFRKELKKLKKDSK